MACLLGVVFFGDCLVVNMDSLIFYHFQGGAKIQAKNLRVKLQEQYCNRVNDNYEFRTKNRKPVQIILGASGEFGGGTEEVRAREF